MNEKWAASDIRKERNKEPVTENIGEQTSGSQANFLLLVPLKEHIIKVKQSPVRILGRR